MRVIVAAFASVLVFLLAAHPSAARPALLFDAHNGKVLYAEDADDQWHPASLTKIMTAYLVFEAMKAGKFNLDSKIPYGAIAAQQPPSKIGLPVGAEMRVDTALKSLIIKSANDIAIMLAEAVAGSEQAFVTMMNDKARKLGMTRTRFANPNGLPHKGQVSTARDLAKLAMAVQRDFPEHAHYWSMERFKLGKRRLGSHNRLLKTFAGADGMKTGFICDSGFNVVASATRDGHQIMAVVLGAVSGSARNVRAAALLEHGFQQYGWKQLFNTTNVDNMPLDVSPKSAVSIRKSVKAYACGGYRPKKRRKVKKRRKKTKTATTASKARASSKTAKKAKKN